MAIKPGIMNIGGGNTAPSSDETKKREEEKISEEEREAARRIVEGYYRNTVSSDNRGFTQDYANAVERAGAYGAGWTNENAPTDDISRAQENASGLARNTELYSGAVDKAFGSGVSGGLYDTYTDASKNLSDIRTGVRAQRDLYNQYENADDYNADQRLFSMSSEELKKESDKIRQTLDETKKNAYKGVLGFGYIKDADGRYRLYTPDSPMAVPDSIKSMEDQLLKLDALYNSKKYSEDVSKYGIDPASMTYDQLMDTMRVGSDDEKRFALDYYNSLGQSNLQTKRAVEWYASLPKDEKAKIDSMWNSAVARGMTSNGVSLYAAQDILRDDLVKNGYTKNEAETMADLYVRHLNEGMNRNVQRVAEQYGSEHPLAYPLQMAAEKALTGYAELLAPALYKIRESATGRPVDVNEPLMVQNRKYETAQTAAQNSDMWKGVQNTASRLFGEESGEQVTRVLSSALYSGMDDAARFLGGLGLGAAGATASAVASVTALLASGGAGLTEFRHNIEEGKSTNEALARGILSAAIEFGTEAVGGEFVWNNILGEGAEGFFKSLAKSALAEGTEEIMGNVASRTLSGIADPDTWNKVGKAFHGGSWGEAGQALINNSEWVKDVKAYTDQGLSLDSAMTRALGDWVAEDAEAFLSAFLSAGLSSGLTKTIRRAETNFSKKVIGDMVNSLTHDGLLKMVRNVEAKLKSGASDGKPYTKEAAADDVERVRGALVNARESVVQSMTGEEATADDRAFAEKEAEKINRAIGQVEELSSAIRNDRTAEIPQIASSIEASIREETEREAEEARTKSKRERAISDFVRGLVYGGTRMAQIDQDLSAEIRRLDADAKSGVEGAQKKLDFANEALAYLRRYAASNMTRDGLESIGKSLDLLGHGKDRSVTIQYDYTWDDDQRNASYNRETNTVTLNPYSPMTQNHVRFVLGHELLHALRADGERGQAIVDSAWNTIQSLMESGQIRRDDENYNMDVLSKLYAGDVRSYLSGEEGRAEVASYVKQGMTEEAARAKATEQYLKEEAVANFFGDASFWGLDKNGNPVDRRTLMWSENDTERQRREKAKQLKNLSPLFDVNAVLSDLTQSKARRVLSDFVRTIRNFARSIVGAKPVEAKRFDTLADAYEAVLKRFDAKPIKDTANTENASEAAQSAATEGVTEAYSKDADRMELVEPGDGDRYSSAINNDAHTEYNNLYNDGMRLQNEAEIPAGENPANLSEPGEVIGDIVVDDDGNTNRFSIRTIPQTEAGWSALIKNLESAGFYHDDAVRWVGDMFSVSAAVMRYREFLDYLSDPRSSWFRKNSDYPQGTVDFSNNCIRRAEFTAQFDAFMKKYPNAVLDASDYETIRRIIADAKIPVTCGGCYVEERRQHLSEVAKLFIDKLNAKKNGETGDNALADKFFSKISKADLSYDISVRDIVSTDGLMDLYNNHRSLYDAFTAYNNARGMQAIRLVYGLSEYDGKIAKWAKNTIARKNNRGGIRIFSYSDADPRIILDFMQIITDAAGKKLKAQGYTKKPWFAVFVKDTGARILRSHIPSGTGLVVRDGKQELSFDNFEGIDTKDPAYAMIDRDADTNIGNNVIGINDEQILFAMLDDFIDQIIPFHSGLKAEIRQQKKIGNWKNYRDYQTDKYYDAETGKWKTADKQVNIYTDVINAINWSEEQRRADGTVMTDAERFVEKYLDVCRARGLKPRFAQFLNDENGERVTDYDRSVERYTYNKGYEKFLVDFRLFDKNGKIIEQEAVEPVFDTEYINSLFEDYMEQNPQAKPANAEVQKKIERAMLDKYGDDMGAPTERSSRSAVSSDYDNLYNEARRLQDEAKTIREKIAELERTEEYQSLFDKVIGGGEDAVEEMSRYIETSGLSELYDRKKTVNEAVNDAQKRISKMIRDNAQKKEREAIERSGGDEAEYFWKAAVKEFGYTPYFYDAGYLLPNGKLLNLSGEKGKHYGSRGQDHRAIGTIFESETGGEAMTRFMNYGNIRVMDETPGVDMYSGVEPTANQYATIRKMAREHEGDGLFVVDFSDENGRNVGNLTYENRINPERIVNDIKYFYETGNIREQSTTDRFRYSRSSVTPEENARYMELANDPVKNADALSEMVEKAARAAGYTVKAYHGTPGKKFNIFNPKYSDDKISLFFTTDRSVADGYADAKGDGGNVIPVYINHDNFLEIDSGGATWDNILYDSIGEYEITVKENGSGDKYHLVVLDKVKKSYEETDGTYDEIVDILSSMFDKREAKFLVGDALRYHEPQTIAWDSASQEVVPDSSTASGKRSGSSNTRQIAKGAKQKGYDGVIYRNVIDTYNGNRKTSDVYNVFGNTLIKSADPVTYDDSGNVIPLSERFNTENQDIRFSRSLTPEQRKLLDAERRVERLKEEKEFFRALTQKGRKAALSPRDADRIVREIQESFDVKDERIRAALGIVDKLYNKKLAGEERKNAEQTLKSTVESIVRDAYDAETEDGDTLAEWVQKAISDNVDGMISAMYAKYAKYGDSALPQQYMARIRQIEADAERDARAYQKRIADLESQARAKAMRGSATEMLDAARKNARYIWSAAKNPTGKKFVPQNARGAMERLANWIDSITVRGGVLKVDWMKVEGDALPSAPVRGDIAVIEKVYGSEYAELADALLNNIDYYAKYQSDADYQRERNAEKSEWIAKSTYKLSQLLRSAVVNQNRVWLDGKRRDAETIGGDMIDALNERRGADERFTSVKDKTFGEKAKEAASKLIHFWKTNPGLAATDAYTFWYRFGDSGYVMVDTLRHAQETQTLRNQEFVEAMQTKLKGIELWNYADEKWDKYTVTFKDARGREVTVPRSVAMSVAALWRRMQGREHLENGGFVYDHDGKRSDPIRVGEKSVKAIEDALTEDDKKVMEVMLSFMRDECTKWGNEATMRRYGFERFTTDNYFRIDVDKFALPANADKSFSGQPKIENTSFAKPTSDGAGAPVVAGDFIRSVIHHVNGMATYSAYLNAEGTVNQLLSTKGLRETMQRVLGNGSVKYVEDLMTDLKSQTKNEEDALEKLWSMGAAYYKTAAVAYNLSTALKQLISYTRAAAVMDTKYLARGMKAVTSSEGRNRALGEMQEFSGTAVKKLNGYSDTGMARDTAMLIGAKKETVRQKTVEFGMRAAEFGDRITWEALWTACREETRDMNPDLTPKELMEATAKRFSSVVGQTQVTNSPLDTAPILRSKSVLTRNLFAFWNEPLKTYNLLMRAYDNIVQAKDGAAAKRALFAAARPVASVAAGMVLEAAVSALFRSLRDDRDDDMDDPETWKKLISLWGGEMVDNAFGVLPYVDQFREVIRNAMNGYSNTDMGLEVITDILDAAKALADSDGEKAKTEFSRIRALAEAVATAFGIPAKNVLRTVKTIASTALNFGGNIKWQYDFQKIFYNPKNATAREKYGFADLLAKAYIEGDEEAYRYIRDDMIQMGLSPASITKSIVKNAAPDDVDGSSSSLTAYKPGSDGWYLAMGAVYDRDTGAPRGLEEEVTRLYEATGDSGVLPNFASDSFTVDGKEVKIEGEAYTEFSENYAKRLYEVQTVIRNTAGYRAATDEQKAWWMEKAETVIGAILKHGIDADYNVTSQGKWIADYLNASDADIARYIVENTKKSGADSQQTRTRGAEVVNTPKSTEFSQIGYDPSTGTLAVTFRDSGATYTYGGVPESEWNAMQSADSIGKYYNANIKGKYKSEKAR